MTKILSICLTVLILSGCGTVRPSDVLIPRTAELSSPRDDTTYLTSLLKRGGSVTIPAGRYVVKQTIMLSNLHGLTVWAYRVTVVSDPSQTIATSVGDTFQLSNCSDVQIYGLSVDGNRVARGGFGMNPETVRLNACSDVLFRDCSFTGDVCDSIFAWSGQVPCTNIDLACRRISVESCRFTDPGRNCISLVGAAWCNVTNCNFTGPGGDPGVAVDVEANNGDPVGINHHITISGNRVSNIKSAFFVIQTTSPHDVVISNNQIDGTSGDGILNFGTNTVVTGNNVSNCARAGISCPRPGTMIQSGNNATVYLEQ